MRYLWRQLQNPWTRLSQSRQYGEIRPYPTRLRQTRPHDPTRLRQTRPHAMEVLQLPLGLIAAIVLGVSARGGERLPLWPEGRIPDFSEAQIAAPSQEADSPDFNRDTARMPYLEWTEPPAKSCGACMIIISGGSYMNTCDGPAFRPFEERLRKAGITCVYLWYRTPRPTGTDAFYRSGWQDGQRAVRLVRSLAKKRGYDPEKIGVIGCSAGSHLSAMLAVASQTAAYEKVDELDEVPCHINWAILHCLAYPVDAPFCFDAKSCPVCFFHGGADKYSPLNSTRAYRRLHEKGVAAELHIDARRGHGFCRPERFERAFEFMREIGVVGKLGAAKALDHRVFPEGVGRAERQALGAGSNKPYMFWFFPEQVRTKAIQVILPGGGYCSCNFNGEGVPLAQYLNTKGMTAVVVMYRTGREDAQAPIYQYSLEDAQKALDSVRTRAKSLGLDSDKVGVTGFSAGGHLALMLSGAAWTVPFYPAYLIEKSGALAPELKLKDSKPMCFLHGDIDGISSLGSVTAWEKLYDLGVKSDMHIFAKANHCFHINCREGSGAWTSFDRIWDFLVDQGFAK